MGGRSQVVGITSVAIAAGMALLACGPSSVPVGADPTTRPPSRPSTTAAATTTTDTEATTTTDTEVTTTATAGSAAPTTTTPVAPTMAPVVTYDAEIDVLTPQPVVAPVRLRIPSLDIEGAIEPTGVNDIGELAVPDDAKTLVWYQFGPSPGAAGSAVIAGHLDWRGALGTFNTLDRTPVGVLVTVDYDDGTQRTFVVRTVELVDKPAVAVNGIFARKGDSVLRLVTCGGDYNDDLNRYYQNVVVTAVPA